MKSRIVVTGGSSLSNNPFQGVDFGALPDVPVKPAETPPAPATPKKIGKIHTRIEKSGRGGKTVTVIFGEGVERLSEEERARLLRAMKNALGVGGTAGKDGTLELQGDERVRAGEWLKTQTVF